MDPKIAADERVAAIESKLVKMGYNMMMSAVQMKLAEKDNSEDDAEIKAKLDQMEKDPESVDEETKQAFVNAIMSDPEMEAQVNDAMKRKLAYKQQIYKEARRKKAEEIAMERTPDAQSIEDVDPELVNAIVEIIAETEGEPMMEDMDIAPEDISDDEMMAALEASDLGIEEGDTAEMKAAKVAELADRNEQVGRPKIARAMREKYLKDFKPSKK